MKTIDKVIFPPDISASLIQGFVHNVEIQIDIQTTYSLSFIDYFKLVEEITRQRDYYEEEFFAKPNWVLIGQLTEENILRVANQLLDVGFYDQLFPNNLVEKNFDSEQLSIKFPEWYVGDDEMYLTEIKGYLEEVKVKFDSLGTYNIDFESFITFFQRAGGLARTDNRFFLAEPSLVLVPKISMAILNDCIEWLARREDYFQYLRPQPTDK